MKRFIVLCVLVGCGPPEPPAVEPLVGVTRNLASPLSNAEAAELPGHDLPNEAPHYVDDEGRHYWVLGNMVAVDCMGKGQPPEMPAEVEAMLE